MKRFLAIVCAVFVLVTAVHAEEVIEDEVPALSDAVDSVVSSVSDLVNSTASETAPGESVPQMSPGGNTVYVLTQPDSEVDNDVSVTPVSIDGYKFL